MVLKIFADKTYFLENKMKHCTVMLYPFFGKPLEDEQDPESGRFDKYINLADSLFKFTSLKDADYAILPADWLYFQQDKFTQDLAFKLIQKSEEAEKKIIIFLIGDAGEDIPPKNTVVFRTSLYKSKRRPYEFSMPAWSEDFVNKYLNDRLPIRNKSKKPVVGFCGVAHLPTSLLETWKDNLYLVAANLGFKEIISLPGHKLRALALSALLKSHNIETNFVIQNNFWGGAVSVSDDKFDLKFKQTVRQNYVKNMVDSDYVLCIRGNGNYSIRFYETLCCGRIPVFIDTDCVLPYDFEIDWKKYCVWINQDEFHLIGQKIAEFHENISNKEFIDLQHECRKIWKNWLSPEGFFTNFYRHFK